LRALDRPAVLELFDSEGEPRYALLRGLNETQADLEIGGERVRVALGEVERHWFGGYLVLWRRPQLQRHVLMPGQRGADVLWLRQRLALAEGKPAAAAGAVALSDVYDSELAERVREFQRSRSIRQDGIAGAETLIQLNTVVNGDSVPRLTTPDA
jgi:general secretion pathway protein A